MFRRRPPHELTQNLRAIWVDGVAYSVMVGIGETYIPAFALALGFSDVASGLVATLPMLCGSLLQLASPKWIAHFRSLKRWAVVCAALQAASFAPLCIAALAGAMPIAGLYFAATLYWAAGLATGPAWNAWVETLIPRRLRIRYFARRWRMMHVSVLCGVFAGGFLLDAFARPADAEGERLYGFAVIFLFAGLARTFSSLAQAQQTEPDPTPAGVRAVGWLELAARFRRGPDGRLLAYMMAMQFSMQVAAPFFTAYMLKSLGLSYVAYMGLVTAAAFGKFASLPLHSSLAHRFGVRAVLVIGGIGIIPAPLFWIATDSLPWLVLAQVYSGAAWAAYELSTFLLFFETIRPQERVSVITKFNVTNASAIFTGSLFGGLLLSGFGGGASAFLGVFAISCALRIGTLPLLRRAGRAPVAASVVITDTLAVRPGSGGFEAPILVSPAPLEPGSPPSGR